MAEIPSTRRVYFYNSRDGDRKYNADGMTDWLTPFFVTGVFNGSFRVTANDNMTVTVAGGYANIKGKVVRYVEPTTLSLEVASGTLSRIDNIVLRRDDTARDIYLAVVKGNSSGNPTAPAPDRNDPFYELVVARVKVSKGVIRITQADITDTRAEAALCGWVVSAVKEIDFSQITAQFDSFFAQYVQLIESIFNAYNAAIEQHGNSAQAAYNTYLDALNTLKIDAYDQVGLWFNPFKAGTVEMVSAWFADYTSTLGPDEAVQLFNKLYAHEQAHAATDGEGAHGLRYSGGKLQALVPGGWVTLAQVVLGYRWCYRDALNLTWAEWDAINYTWAEYDNLIETEAE